jgi:hypothetical protein
MCIKYTTQLAEDKFPMCKFFFHFLFFVYAAYTQTNIMPRSAKGGGHWGNSNLIHCRGADIFRIQLFIEVLLKTSSSYIAIRNKVPFLLQN